MDMILGIIFGGALVTVLYETCYEKRGKKVQSLLSPKLEELIEETSLKVSEKRKMWKRELTDMEKDDILDECLGTYNKNLK